jgi:hypothetical protein
MKLIKIPEAPKLPTWVGSVECTFVSLNKRQRKYLNNFVRRNKDVMTKKTVWHVENNRLGIVQLLHLLNRIGEDKLLDAHPLDHRLVYDYPKEYFKLAARRKIGRKQRKTLFKEPGV